MNPEHKNISNNIEPVPAGVKRPLWSVMIPTFNPIEEFIKELSNYKFMPIFNHTVEQEQKDKLLTANLVRTFLV